MRAQVGPSSRDIKSVSEYDAYLKKKEDVVVIGFFEKDSDLKAEYLKTADKMREEITFAHTSDKSVLEKAGFK